MIEYHCPMYYPHVYSSGIFVHHGRRSSKIFISLSLIPNGFPSIRFFRSFRSFRSIRSFHSIRSWKVHRWHDKTALAAKPSSPIVTWVCEHRFLLFVALVAAPQKIKCVIVNLPWKWLTVLSYLLKVPPISPKHLSALYRQLSIHGFEWSCLAATVDLCCF